MAIRLLDIGMQNCLYYIAFNYMVHLLNLDALLLLFPGFNLAPGVHLCPAATFRDIFFVFSSSKTLTFFFFLMSRENLIHKEIERRVALMQTVIELGRVVRDRKTLPLKVGVTSNILKRLFETSKFVKKTILSVIKNFK